MSLKDKRAGEKPRADRQPRVEIERAPLHKSTVTVARRARTGIRAVLERL